MKTPFWKTWPALSLSLLVYMILSGWLALRGRLDGNITQDNLGLLAAQILSMCIFMAHICVWYWQKIDEAAREAHKWAWYWGGSAGLTCVVPLFIISFIEPDFQTRIVTFFNATGYDFLTGLCLGTGLPILGYCIAWGLWWLSKR